MSQRDRLREAIINLEAVFEDILDRQDLMEDRLIELMDKVGDLPPPRPVTDGE